MGNYSGLNVSIEDVEFLNASLETMQLMKKISRSNESKKRDTAKILIYIKGPHLELLGGERQQSSHGTGGGAWAQTANPRKGVTKKVYKHLI